MISNLFRGTRADVRTLFKIPEAPETVAPAIEGVRMPEDSFRERRASRGTSEMSPIELVQDNLDCAERQLAAAQAILISARQRVASLQAATENWAEFAIMLDAPSRALTH